MVSPSAKVAAIITFCVPLTVTESKLIWAPWRRAPKASIVPWSRRILAPNACRPFKCWSTGRTPIAHPPGSDTRPHPNRATNGPNTMKDARIFRTKSYGASGVATVSEEMRTARSSSGSQSARAPKARSISSILSTSRTRGTLRKTDSPRASNADVINASVAFFDPATRTSPDKREPPRTTIRSITVPSSFWGAPESDHHTQISRKISMACHTLKPNLL